MTDLTTVAPPLTRRQAREIERSTGRRPVAGADAFDAQPRTSAFTAATPIHDTSHIERNAVTSLVSVLPTEALNRLTDTVAAAVTASDSAPATDAAVFARSATTRAARPTALVARTRRRASVGFGIAASAAVLATAAVATPGAMADLSDQQAGQAALVTADTVTEAGAAPDAAAQSAAWPATDLVAAPEAAADRAQYAVTAFEPNAVDEVAQAPVADTTSAGSGSSSGETQTTGGGSGAIDLAGIAATAASMVGTGGYTHCDAFTREVYAAHGITLGVGVSAQAAQGTPTSNPQPGDLVVWPGQHIAIYAGNGQVYDSPGIDDPRPIQHRAISWGSPYYVTLN